MPNHPQRSVAVPALDVGLYSFGSFLEERLEDLKNDLLQECDRIAMERELLLKKQLHEALKQNEELQHKLQGIAAGAGSNGNQAEVGHSAPEDSSHMITSSLDPDAETSPDRTPDKGLKSDNFDLWGEWTDSAGTLMELEDESEDSEHEKSVWDHEPPKHSNRRSPCTLDPSCSLFVGFEIIGIPLLFYDILAIPMQVFHTPDGIFFEFIGWLITLYWTADILLRLLVVGQITDEGTIMLERRGFMKMYLRTSFTFDFVMVAPDWFTRVVGAGGLRNIAIFRLFRLFRFLRILRMSKMKKLFRNVQDAVDSEYFTVVVSLVNNLLGVLIMCHYCACFWFLVGSVKIDGEQSWIEQHLRDEPWETKYVLSLHWAVAQFTPGASKIQPTNNFEAVACILVLISGLIFWSLFVSALSHARMRLQALTSKIDRDSWMLRRYLRQSGVSTILQARTSRYVEKCLEPMFARVQRKDVVLLPFLSRPLQLAVQEEQYFHTLIAHPLLKSLRERSESFVLDLFMNVIVEILLADSDLLFEAGSIAHEVNFVSRGVLAYRQQAGKELDFVEVGDWCCEAVLWVAWVYRGMCKAHSESQVISINSARLRAAVQEHNVRNYVAKCARAYLKDLNELADQGMPITDITKVTDIPSSKYMETIRAKGLNKSSTDNLANDEPEVSSVAIPPEQATPIPPEQATQRDSL